MRAFVRLQGEGAFGFGFGKRLFAIWTKAKFVCEYVIFTTIAQSVADTTTTPTGVGCEEV